ncbi:hypothetical protein [Pseudobutyrivibrio sp.]|uniref:hypothetical protein n=1 Tax=Pseudobutyrivibrio sp. TaxID=2014367 RepID=UPI00386BDEFC
MEKTLNIIDIILGVIVHLSVVFAAFIGAEDIYIAVNGVREPGNLRQLPLGLSLFALLVVVRVVCGLFQAICSRYIEKRNSAAICITFSIIMTALLAIEHPVVGIICAIAYVTIGGMIPVSNAMNIEKLKESYHEVREEGNDFIADVAYGIDEVLQYGRGQDTIVDIGKRAMDAADAKQKLLDHEKSKQQLLALARSVFTVIILFLLLFLYSRGKMRMEDLFIVCAGAVFSFRECNLE